jgi:4-amino-4-deoxy-L-arabinose transferase-like glycosyltransferase
MNRSTLIVIGLTVMGFLLRFYRLDLPDRLIGDEVYYVPAARSILGNNEEGVPRDTIRGHPPLAKMLIAAGMLFFGDNPLGWRIMSVVAGTLAIPVFYLLVRRLFWGRRGVAYAPLIATYIFSFETLTFYFSRVARIDIFMLLFLLAGIYFLLEQGKWRKLVSTPFFAASFLSKEAAIIAFLPLIIHSGLRSSGKPRKKTGQTIRMYDMWTTLTLLVTTAVSTISIWYLLEWVILAPSAPNLVERLAIMVSRLSISNPEAVGRSELWQWFINYPVTRAVGIQPGFEIDPSRVATGPLVTSGLRYAYIIQVSWTILLFMIPIMLYMLWLARRDSIARFTIFYWMGGLLGWLIVNTVFRGLLYLFYILIVLPPVIIALSLYLGNRLHSERGTKNIRWRGLTALYLLLHLLNFVALYPVPAA